MLASSFCDSRQNQTQKRSKSVMINVHCLSNQHLLMNGFFKETCSHVLERTSLRMLASMTCKVTQYMERENIDRTLATRGTTTLSHPFVRIASLKYLFHTVCALLSLILCLCSGKVFLFVCFPKKSCELTQHLGFLFSVSQIILSSWISRHEQQAVFSKFRLQPSVNAETCTAEALKWGLKRHTSNPCMIYQDALKT